MFILVSDSAPDQRPLGKDFVSEQWAAALCKLDSVRRVRVPGPSRSDRDSGVVLQLLRLLVAIMPIPAAWSWSLRAWGRVFQELRGGESSQAPVERVIVDHFRVGWSALLSRWWFGYPTLLLAHNAEALAIKSFIRHEGRWRRIASYADLLSVRLWEHVVARSVDCVVCLNRNEAAYFERLGAQRVEVIYPTAPIFSEAGASRSVRDRKCRLLDGEATILWVGSFLYHAKVLNALWFLEEIWPTVKRELPLARLIIVGVGTDSLEAKARASLAMSRLEGVDFLGEVDSLDDVYGLAVCAIIPERYGGGFKLKLLEAAARRVPVVSDPRASDGTSFSTEDVPHAVTPIAWACVIKDLAESPELRRKIVEAQLNIVRRHHAVDAFQRRVSEVVRQPGGTDSRAGAKSN